jgi:hypothetical protein
MDAVTVAIRTWKRAHNFNESSGSLKEVAVEGSRTSVDINGILTIGTWSNMLTKETVMLTQVGHMLHAKGNTSRSGRRRCSDDGHRDDPTTLNESRG